MTVLVYDYTKEYKDYLKYVYNDVYNVMSKDDEMYLINEFAEIINDTEEERIFTYHHTVIIRGD